MKRRTFLAMLAGLPFAGAALPAIAGGRPRSLSTMVPRANAYWEAKPVETIWFAPKWPWCADSLPPPRALDRARHVDGMRELRAYVMEHDAFRWRWDTTLGRRQLMFTKMQTREDNMTPHEFADYWRGKWRAQLIRIAGRLA